MVTSGMADKRRHARKKQPKRNTITKRWVFNNLGLIFLVLLAIDFGVIYSLQNYYYNAAQQYLTTKATSISGVLTRYAQDADANFSSELRSTLENFSDKDKMELMAINAKGTVVLTSSGFSPPESISMPDYQQAMEKGTGYWTGRINQEKVMAVSINISAVNTDYDAMNFYIRLNVRITDDD